MRPSRGLFASASNTFAAALGSAASLVLTILVAHRLGLRILGDYAVMGTVYGVLGVVDSARTQDLTTRYAAGGGNEPTRLRAVIATAAVAVSLVGALAFGAVTDTRGAEGALVAWLGAAAQIMTAEAVASTQVQRKFQHLALATAAGPILGCALAAVLLTHLGLLALGLGLFVSSVATRMLLLADPEIRAQARRAPNAEAEVAVKAQTLSLTLLGGAAQLVTFTDVIVVRALASAAAVGKYRAGSQIPTVLIGLIYRGFDTLMPRLAAEDEPTAVISLRRMAPWLAVVVGVASGVVVGLRSQLIDVVLGHSNHSAETVLWLFAIVWMANSVIHPATLLLIARRRQRSIVMLVALEYVANLVLTVALVPSLGAVGSAIATLITLAASNLVLLPRVLARELPYLPVARHLGLDCVLPTVVSFGIVAGVLTLV